MEEEGGREGKRLEREKNIRELGEGGCRSKKKKGGEGMRMARQTYEERKDRREGSDNMGGREREDMR